MNEGRRKWGVKGKGKGKRVGERRCSVKEASVRPSKCLFVRNKLLF